MPTIDHLVSILTTAAVVVHWGIIIGLGLRIILTRRPTGVSLAWLLLITSVPYVGAGIYLFVGELWLPKRRMKLAQLSRTELSQVIDRIEDQWEMADHELPDLAVELNAHAQAPFGLSALGGNELKIYSSCNACLDEMICDIKDAQKSVSMLFYIWESKGQIRQIEEAMIEAVQRGVECRLLLDSAGSKKFLQSRRAVELQRAGIVIAEALPASFLRVFFKRIDIRNHRKIVAVDNRVAYTGSMNMVDPAYFNAGRGVGQWIDVMARVRGPAARVLSMNLAMDWAIDYRRDAKMQISGPIESIRNAEPIGRAGDIVAQVVPSGPDQASQLIHELLITLIYNTRRRLIITTPYFVPSDSMLQALISAAHRGVRVSLVVPEKIDSVLVRHASRSYFQDLLNAGVEIHAYRGGLLHAKTVTADDDVALLGSVNMDLRSFSINFEISMFIYNQATVQEMKALQKSYMDDAVRIESHDWERRPVHSKLLENALQLLSPIL
ncbi:MAG: cardiolipin synthase [Phycisphaerales bacterium JB052]